MGYPQWKTAAGDLGKIAELEYWNLLLEANDPESVLNINKSAEQLGRDIAVNSKWTVKNGLINFVGTGLPYHGYGVASPIDEPMVQNYDLTWTCRAGTRQQGTSTAVTEDMIGMWMNGVAIYSARAPKNQPEGFPAAPLGFAYNSSFTSNLIFGYDFEKDDAGGHADTKGKYHYSDYLFESAWELGQGAGPGSATDSGLAEVAVIPYLYGGLYHPDGHSKILGFAFDGYPIYGPRAYVDPGKIYSGTLRMKSGYALRDTSWRTGTLAADLVQWPLGIFIEDYEFVGGGDLDAHNGRYCVTPDYPDGTYAYFCTLDVVGHPAFPYVIGTSFYDTPTRFALPGQAGVPKPVSGNGFAPANVVAGTNVTFSLIAGRLPPGIQLDPLGSLAGQPATELTNIRGVPTAVNRDKDYTFTIRASSNSNPSNVSDRTFKVTITGNNRPDLLTGSTGIPPVDLGSYLDGTSISIQLEAVDLDNPILEWTISDGKLPTGLKLNSTTGLISGVSIPYVSMTEGATTGYDKSRWEEYSWDFTTRSINRNYSFTVRVSDGKQEDVRKFYIQIYAHDDIRADNTVITSDREIFTTDMDEKRPPVLLTEDLGVFSTYKADNYFSYKFDVVGLQNQNGYSVDLDGDAVKFSMIAGEGVGFDTAGSYFDMALFDKGAFALPDGLEMQEDTGWLIGYLPAQITPSVDYQFGVQVYKRDYPTYLSEIRLFNLTILGNLNLDINWITDNDITPIQAGEISKISIEAISKSGQSLTYSLKNGSRLPQGLKLLNDGTLSGRCSFQSFSLDKGTTTFDVALAAKGFTTGITVFDKTYTFTVIATNSAGTASTEKTFYLPVNIVTPDPYENVYMKCLPSSESRSKISSIINDKSIFSNDSIYRANDPFFGRQQNIVLLSSYGLTASTAADYIAAMESRHYNKKFYFGNYGLSISRDNDDNIEYEVIWVELIEETRAYVDRAKQGVPTGTVDIRKKIVNWQNPSYDPEDPAGYTLKINDEQLMRRDLVNALGRTNPTALPTWMSSIQRDGTVSGYVTCAPLVYVKPGEGDKILFRLNRAAKKGNIPDITDVEFIADRYILDDNLSQYFDTTLNKFEDHYYTSFDIAAKLPSELTPVAVVDFATELPFNYINGRSIAQLSAAGGLDGVITSFIDKTLIFAQQELFVGYPEVNPTNDGWEKFVQYYDSVEGYDEAEFSQSEIIPGYVEHGATPSIKNKRAGIWKITLDDNGLIELSFQQELDLQNVIDIRYGGKYGGNKILYSVANIVPPYTVPNWQIIEPATIQEPNPTTFDENSTRFLNAIDVYQAPEEGDRYLKFPKTGIFS